MLYYLMKLGLLSYCEVHLDYLCQFTLNLQQCDPKIKLGNSYFLYILVIIICKGQSGDVTQNSLVLIGFLRRVESAVDTLWR